MAKQGSFLRKTPTEFGGTLLKGNPRGARPLFAKRPLHLVLKSSLCKGKFSLLSRGYAKRVQATVHFYAKKNGIKVYRYQNVGNHLHLVIYGARSKTYAAFIRAVCGRIAQTLLKDMGYDSQGGDPSRSHTATIRFWDYRPFSRAIFWGRDFSGVKTYVLKNLLDRLGLARTTENLSLLKRLRRRIRSRAEDFDEAQLRLAII